jgi:hypothetical protein
MKDTEDRGMFVLFVLVLFFFGMVIGLTLGLTRGNEKATDEFEKRAIEAGVGYYNPTNKTFMFQGQTTLNK